MLVTRNLLLPWLFSHRNLRVTAYTDVLCLVLACD
jgi:hypothetical protein